VEEEMSRQMLMALHNDELIVDSFAGGGASHGIEIALGRSPDIAINHDATHHNEQKDEQHE